MSWVVPGTCYSGLTQSKRIVQEGEICLPDIPITRANRSLLSRRAGTQDFSESWGFLCSLLLETQITQCLTPDPHIYKFEPYHPGSSPNVFPLSPTMTPPLRAKSRSFFPDRRWLAFVSLHQPEAKDTKTPRTLILMKALTPQSHCPMEVLDIQSPSQGSCVGARELISNSHQRLGVAYNPFLYDISLFF